MDNLPLEQQFEIAKLQSYCNTLSDEELRALLKALYRQMLVRKNLYEQAIAQQWGMEK